MEHEERKTLYALRVHASGRAFTMVELLVVLGVIMMLIGLILPAFGSAYSTAKLTRDMIRLRDNSVMVTLYTQDNKDIYPLANLQRGPLSVARRWGVPMVAGGYFDSITQIDDRSDENGVGFSIGMSAAMVYDWKLMRPGHTVPYDEAVAVPVRSSSVTFPSLKAMLYRSENRYHDALNGRPLPDDYYGFCCVELWEFPVANADTSVIKGHWKFFNGGRPLHEENHIGMPVAATWFGVKGQDR